MPVIRIPCLHHNMATQADVPCQNPTLGREGHQEVGGLVAMHRLAFRHQKLRTPHMQEGGMNPPQPPLDPVAEEVVNAFTIGESFGDGLLKTRHHVRLTRIRRQVSIGLRLKIRHAAPERNGLRIELFPITHRIGPEVPQSRPLSQCSHDQENSTQ